MDPGPTRSQLAALAQERSGNRPSVVGKGEKKTHLQWGHNVCQYEKKQIWKDLDVKEGIRS